MQCVSLLRKKKKSLEDSEEEEARSYRAKRVCLEAELLSVECPMETSLTFTASNQRPEQQMQDVVQPRPPALCCPRCLGGEPGHINHIMRH